MSTQMNVRMDEQLKRKGDAVFAAAGFSPTQVVRRVWEFAAEHGDNPALIREVLTAGLAHSREIVATNTARELEEAASVCSRLREQLGLKPPDTLEAPDYREMRERALYERMAERGLA